MKGMPIDDAAGHRAGDSLERAAEQALELRSTLTELPDPFLREIVDVLLLELARSLASQARSEARVDPFAPSGERVDVLGEVIEAIERCRRLD